MNITKEKEEIIIRLPFWKKRSNPYMPNEDVGKYPSLTGLIIKHRKDGNHYDEIGFAQTIDMDYANKSDQIGGFVITWDGEEKEFIEKCKELGLKIKYRDF